MNQRRDVISRGHKIKVDNYTLYLDVKMHIDETGDMHIAIIDRIKVTEIFDRAKRKDIDRIRQYPFFHE